MLTANGNPERAEILKQHADEEVCALVLSLLDKVPELWRRRRAKAQDEANPDVNSQVKTETTADLNVLHERRSKAAAEGYERRERELKRAHEEEKAQLTENFEAAEDVLKVKGHTRPPAAASAAFSDAFVFRLKAEVQQLAAELQDYNQLKKRVQESTFFKDLQRNIQVTPPGGHTRHRTTYCCFRV